MQLIVNKHTVFYAFYCLRLLNSFWPKEFYSKTKELIETLICHAKYKLTYHLTSPFQAIWEPIVAMESPLNLAKEKENAKTTCHN